MPGLQTLDYKDLSDEGVMHLESNEIIFKKY
jgi:hypothetical protein